MRIVHYLNQFFGGLGGEEHAGIALEIRDGAVGPGKLLEQLLGSDCDIVTTLVCGDNYAVENQDAVTADGVGTDSRCACRSVRRRAMLLSGALWHGGGSAVRGGAK